MRELGRSAPDIDPATEVIAFGKAKGGPKVNAPDAVIRPIDAHPRFQPRAELPDGSPEPETDSREAIEAERARRMAWLDRVEAREAERSAKNSE